jgi:hypothetical protein
LPCADAQLAGDQSRAIAVAILDNLHNYAKRPERASLRYAKAPLSPRYWRELHHTT